MARVLIVFSQPNSTDMAARVCAEYGHAVAFASESDAMARLSQVAYDLVLLCVTVPLPVARFLRTTAPGVPIVVVTDHLADVAAAAIRQAGVRSIVFRPFGTATLAKVIENELSQAPQPEVASEEASRWAT